MTYQQQLISAYALSLKSQVKFWSMNCLLYYTRNQLSVRTCSDEGWADRSSQLLDDLSSLKIINIWLGRSQLLLTRKVNVWLARPVNTKCKFFRGPPAACPQLLFGQQKTENLVATERRGWADICWLGYSFFYNTNWFSFTIPVPIVLHSRNLKLQIVTFFF